MYLCARTNVISTMFSTHNLASLVLSLFFLAACSSRQDNSGVDRHRGGTDVTDEGMTAVDESSARDRGIVIQSEPYSTNILSDANGNISHAARSLLHKNELVKTYYQRVGCKNTDCKEEWVTFTAVQYPKDSVLQKWVAEVVGKFYFDATRDLDIKVNGERSETNDDGEMTLQNTGCRPYGGVLQDGEKAMFDYYQSQLWAIGKNREDEHGPSGRYGCILYRCWQTPDIVSYFVAYSTDVQQPSRHYVVSFDRRTGEELSFADIVKDDYVAELNDLVIDAAHQRHRALLRSKNNDLAIDKEEGDYSSMVPITYVGFVQNGLAVSTDALPFDQWAFASHILVIPYEKVNHLLLERFRR